MKQIKLVTVTRADLTPAQQAVQSAHASIDFCFAFNNKASPWHKESQYLVMLSLPDEEALQQLILKCKLAGISYTAFYEPDLNNQLTPICLEPGPITQKLVKRIPLMFKQNNNESI